MIIETQYLPSILVFSQLLGEKELIIEAHENYQKRSFRNRSYLAGSQGINFLSVPLKKGKNEQMDIRKVEISYAEPWVKQHLSFVQTNYGRAPFFIHYFDNLREILLSGDSFLYDLNLKLWDWILDILSLNMPIIETTEYKETYDANLTDWRNTLDIHIWNKQIKPNLPKYPQVFEEKHEFIPFLSIMDLIFCQGPESIVYLRKLTRHIPMILSK